MGDSIEMQRRALYAAQAYAYHADFPKGFILRIFVAFYDTDLVEEEAFMSWREDLSDDYPGKVRRA